MAVAAPKRTTPAAEAWALLGQLFRTHMRPRFMAVAAEADLSPPQIMALQMLQPDTPVAMSKLADALACDNSNVTGLVDRLEARGLVERQADERDRRVRMLVVTPEGVRLRERIAELMSEPAPPISSLSRADQRALRDVLRRALAP